MNEDTKVFLIKTTLTYDMGYAVEAKSPEEAINLLKKSIEDDDDYYKYEVYQSPRQEIVSDTVGEISEIVGKPYFRILKACK